MSSSTVDEEKPQELVTRAVAGATIWIYPETGDLRINATEVFLPPSQKRVLACLARSQGIVSKDELAKVVPAPGYPPAHHDVVDIEVRKLRQSLNGDEPGTGLLIVTLTDGYRLCDSAS